MFLEQLERKEIHTGSGVQCHRARRHCCCCCYCCCHCCRPGSVAATGNGCGQQATSDGVVGVVVGGVATRPRRRAAGGVSTAAATVGVGVGGRWATGDE